MLDKSCFKEKLKLINFYNVMMYKREFRKEHPDYFNADGLLMFVGAQGSGKTLSAVNYVVNLLNKYPKSKLVTNVVIQGYEPVEFKDFKTIKKNKDKKYKDYLNENRIFFFNDDSDFKRYDNGEFGVIFLVDEIQLYLNSLESKNINIDVLTQISQQRKQRKHIVATSQVFGRIAKPLREQFSNIVLCKSIMGIIQKNMLLDRDSISTDNSSGTELQGEVKSTNVFIHSPQMYKRYSTYSVIERGKFKSDVVNELYDKGGNEWNFKSLLK